MALSVTRGGENQSLLGKKNMQASSAQKSKDHFSSMRVVAIFFFFVRWH